MPVRALTRVALVVASFILVPATLCSASDLTAPVVAALPAPAALVQGDSLDAGTVLQNGRTAYQEAWAKREAGELEKAKQILEVPALQIDAVLKTDLDATRRRDLIELRGKIEGLRDVTLHGLDIKNDKNDAPAPAAAKASADVDGSS